MLTEREREREREREGEGERQRETQRDTERQTERERILYWFASHYDILTQPQLFSCYIINFNDPIHLTSVRPIAHLIHFLYHSPWHSDLPFSI